MAEPVHLEVLPALADPDVLDVGLLVERVTEVDGTRPLSEHVMLHLRYGGDSPVRHLLLRRGTELVGYAHLDLSDTVAGPSAELAVAPDARRAGLGRMLAAALVNESPDGRLRVWAHGLHPAAARLAESMGWHRTRVLHQLRRSLAASLPAPVLPPDVTLRPFRPGADDEDWVALNARAFADLPDQGGWTLGDLRVRMRQPWFDPDGFLVAERDGAMVGFHWTKVHGSRDGGDHPHGQMGEVYVVGVDPAYQGHGLGRALTLAGLAHLRGRGIDEAMLYVDAENTAALALYRSLGFRTWGTDVQYSRDATTT